MNQSGNGNLFVRSVFTAAILLALKLPAPALTFNVTFDGSVTILTNATQVETAFTNATLVFQNLYTNPMTVNLTVFFSSGVNLGQSGIALTGNPTYVQLTNALRAARTTAAASNSVASLPPTDPTPNSSAGTNWWVPTTEAKALNGSFGVTTNNSSQDGSVTFASTVSYTFDPTNRAVSGKFDFIAVAEHEISEVLGRIDGLNIGNGGYVPYDLFRFTNNGARSLNVNSTNVYFSVDDGVTSLKTFNTNGNGGDLQDWASSSTADSLRRLPHHRPEGAPFIRRPHRIGHPRLQIEPHRPPFGGHEIGQHKHPFDLHQRVRPELQHPRQHKHRHRRDQLDRPRHARRSSHRRPIPVHRLHHQQDTILSRAAELIEVFLQIFPLSLPKACA